MTFNFFFEYIQDFFLYTDELLIAIVRINEDVMHINCDNIKLFCTYEFQQKMFIKHLN